MLLPLRAQAACTEKQCDDEVSLVQLSKNVVNRNQKASPAEEEDSNVIQQEMTVALDKDTIAGLKGEEGHGPVNVSIVMGMGAPAADNAPPGMGMGMPGMPMPGMPQPGMPGAMPQPGMPQPGMPGAMPPGGVVDPFAPPPPQPGMLPGQLPGMQAPPGQLMGQPVGNITIVISPPLSVDPEQPGPDPNIPITVVPANMVKGYEEPTTAVPANYVVGYVPPPPPTAAPPMQMAPPMMMPQPMMPQPQSFTGVPVSAMGGVSAVSTGSQADPATADLVKTLLAPAAAMYGA